MESRAPRPGFSLDALIAEAKRRARQRRLLVAMLLLVIAAVVGVAVFGPPGSGSRSGGVAGRLGSGPSGSESVHVGALALTVPHGFYADKIPCPIRHCPLGGSPIQVLVTNHPLTVADSPTAKGPIYPANFVVLDFGYLSAGEIARTRPPLNLHEFRPMGHALGDGTAWSQIVSGGGSSYSVWVFEGSKAPPADRTAVLRALRSIHEAR